MTNSLHVCRRVATLATLVFAFAPTIPASAQQPDTGSGIYRTARGMVLRVDRGPLGATVTLLERPYNSCFRPGDVGYRLPGPGPTFHGTSLLRKHRTCEVVRRRGRVTASLRPGRVRWVLRVNGRRVLIAVGPKVRPVPQCSDEQLAGRHGLHAGGGNAIDGYDRRFAGERGKRFRRLIESVAIAVGIDPGSLAVNAIAEKGQAVWLQRGPVESPEAGLDYWGSFAPGIKRDVPAAARLRPRRLDRHFINENHVDTGPVYVFRNGRDALLAVAARLRHLEFQMPAQYAQLSAGARFALLRYAYNASPTGAREWAARADAEAFLKPDGVIDPNVDARRVATVRGGQAVHMSQRFFGATLPCQ